MVTEDSSLIQGERLTFLDRGFCLIVCLHDRVAQASPSGGSGIVRYKRKEFVARGWWWWWKGMECIVRGNNRSISRWASGGSSFSFGVRFGRVGQGCAAERRDCSIKGGGGGGRNGKDWAMETIDQYGENNCMLVSVWHKYEGISTAERERMSQEPPEQEPTRYGDIFPVSGELSSKPVAPGDAAMMQSAEKSVLGQNQKGRTAAVMQSAAARNERAGVVGHRDVTEIVENQGVTLVETDRPGTRVITESVGGQVFLYGFMARLSSKFHVRTSS
ncbi:hypothetical protein F511_19082 [Dorcoceras hygrometricum]|uniref:SMP domain-containing protein n=1 Tax=Dorcoceras hygrometricum TaxID=472368 RepID=A0A2Z7C5H4_9LAMI|nr:hypothetical protein F511_19082 [Dorcoceras hygrometricum]